MTRPIPSPAALPPETTAPPPHELPPTSRGLILLVFFALVLIWGSTWYVIRIGLESYPPFFSLTVRFLVAGPALLLVMKLRKDPIPWQLRHQPFFFGVGFLSFVMSYGVVYWGEQYVPSGLAAVVFGLFPIFVGVVGHFFLPEERMGWARLAGLALGLGGIAVINSGDLALLHPLAPVAALVIVISPFVSALANVLTKRVIHDYPILAFSALPMTYGGLCHVILWRVFERDVPLRWAWPGVFSIAYLTILGSMVTFAGYFWLLRRIAAGRAALVAYLTPLVALAIGAFVGGEAITLPILIGTALVLSGVAIANRAQRHA
jgi:drug/metabolite transporter (DMT)-like permease